MYLRGWAGCKFARSRVLPARLSEKFDPNAVLPLQAMYADLMFLHPGPPDAQVCGPHQSDGNHTLDASARPGVGLQPIFCEEAGYTF